MLADALAEHVGRRLRGRLEPEIESAVADARIAVDGLLAALKGVPTDKERGHDGQGHPSRQGRPAAWPTSSTPSSRSAPAT